LTGFSGFTGLQPNSSEHIVHPPPLRSRAQILLILKILLILSIGLRSGAAAMDD
jgi:hypothetical protein